MIQIISNGNMFESKHETLTNPINCMGVMGKGLAKVFKEKYPDMFKIYKQLCNENKVKIGSLYLSEISGQKILMFPTKFHWKNKSKLLDIELGLDYLVKNQNSMHMKSLAIPGLGCGEGGLKWGEVKPIMIKYLEQLNIDVEIYEPH